MAKLKKVNYDEGVQETDILISKMEKEISKEYQQAYEEVSKKLNKYMEGFEEREEWKRLQLLNNEITEKEFNQWRLNQIAIGDRWKDMQDTLARDLVLADKKAASIINGYTPSAYALNHNFGTYEIEKGTNINTSYTLYNIPAVERLISKKPNLLPKAKVDASKDEKWNKKKINSAIMQGILQGDDLKSVSKRLQSVTDMDDNAAIRNARTMMTGAQNAGRLDAYRRSAKLGIKIQKQWMATLDKHTRESHRAVDGEVTPLNKTFSNGLMYPGDTDRTNPAEVYNCRCTLVANYPEYPDGDYARYDNIAGKPIKNVTFSEWLKAHESGDIDKFSIVTKKEYDFEAKLRLYNSSKTALEESEKKFRQAKNHAKWDRSLEDEMDSLKNRYGEIADWDDNDVARIQKEVDKLEKEIKEVEVAYDKWYERPPRSNEKAFNEWREWKWKWEEEHDDTAPSIMSKLQEKKFEYERQLRDYESFKDGLKFAKEHFKPRSELMESYEKIRAEYEKVKAEFDKNFAPMDEIILDAYKRKIGYKRTEELSDVLSGNEIIRKLAGGDKTEGSCQSLALCYAGNKAGIDVTDFRGGNSQDFFSRGDMAGNLLKAGMKGKEETGYNQQSLAIKLLKGMEENKEYILSGGQHAAVVRKTPDGMYQYLEMQSAYSNGWKNLGTQRETISETLKWRFGMSKSRTWMGMKVESTVCLLDVDSAKDVENFDVLMGFMNTDIDKQMKGLSGNIK